jgi:hypothetical protein
MDFADEGVIYSIYGSLEEQLFLGISRSIIKLTEKGKVSRIVFQTEYPVIEFWNTNDTIYANTEWSIYYSTDNWETWKVLGKERERVSGWEFSDSKNTIYHHVYLPIGEIGTPSLIMRSSDNGTNWENVFPYKHYEYSMYLDSKDRLYVGTNDSEWDGFSFTLSTQNTAILYYQTK